MKSSPAESLATSRLIVCESSGRWSALLRVELAEASAALWECRRLDEAWSALAETPAAFLVAEARQENLDELLEGLSRLARDFPAARAAVVVDRALARYEWLVREAGAIQFVASPRLLGPLARLIVRHLAQAPLPVRSVVERIWASLPWPPRGK